MSTGIEYTKRVVKHYITETMEAAGLNVDYDTFSEIDAAFDELMEAVTTEVRGAIMAYHLKYHRDGPDSPL